MVVTETLSETLSTLAQREQYRDVYWLKKDPILHDRLLWRAQTFRHMVHLLPGQSILELGCGKGLFTKQLAFVSKGENPITALTFDPTNQTSLDLPSVTWTYAETLPGSLQGKKFDFIVAMDLLDKENAGEFLQQVYELLEPGGQVLFYESNPWNVVLQLRRFFQKQMGSKDPRGLMSRPELYELISEIGYINIFTVYNDFVYAPLSSKMIWTLRNLSLLLENAPTIRTLAGSILIHAKKPPRVKAIPRISLCKHANLFKSISVVVPCHNEEMNVEPLVHRLMDFYGDYIHEMILVDDNSKDRTKDVIFELQKKYPQIKPVIRTPPNGVGRAIRDGYKAATGKYILSMDCDFQHLLPELQDLFDELATGADVVVGSRFSRHSVLLNYPFKKIVANRAFHALARIMLWHSFRDLTNNLKIIRRDIAETLPFTQNGFAINAETGFLPMLAGYEVREVPISWINRGVDMGVSSFKLIKVGGGYWHVLLGLWKQQISKKLNRKKSAPKTK
jgi:dolichol-phosphate mannosyltransferase